MSGGMNAARNFRIATSSKGNKTSAANTQSGPPECKMSGRSTPTLMPVEAANVIPAMVIVGELAGIFVVAVLRAVQLCPIQHYDEHRSLHIREILHASCQRLAGCCAAT